MPIPKPQLNESDSDFIDRCMSDDTMKSEYDNKQRLAICKTKLENNNMKTDEKRHVKEIIEDEETITIVYEKTDEFEGVTIKDSDVPDEGDEETVGADDTEEADSHYDEEDELVEEEEEVDEEDMEEDEVEDDVDDEEDEDEEEDRDEHEEDEEEELDEEEDEADEEMEEDEEEEDEEEEEEEEEKKRDIWDTTDSTEKRFFSVETRVTKKGKRNIVEGHAAVFNQLSEDLGGFREMIKPGAFDNVLKNDVRAFFNHDPNFLLARSSAGTLKLSTDKKGLKYSFDVPDTTAGRDLLVSMKRGDITQSSFAFQVEKDSWKDSNKGEIRTIEKVARLFDVSPVSIPAYPDANDLTIAKRSRMIYKDKQKMNDEREYERRTSLLGLKINIIKRK